jgi:D-threo-aldose 1-dehydrogenase
MTDAITPMPAAILGRTGLATSRLSIGTWGFGPVGAPETRIADDSSLEALLSAAFAAGVTMLDSAEAYQSEARLGSILAKMETPEGLVITTKFGHGKGFSADAFRRSAEQTLIDLRLEQLPLMFVHDPRNADDMAEVLGAGGALEGMRRLQDEGLLAHIGIATGTFQPLETAVDSDEFDCIQFPRLYTLLNTASKTRGLLERAREREMGTLNPAPFAGNILATGTIDGALYCYKPALPEVLGAVKAMETRCAELGIELPAAALAFSLTEPLIDVTVVGVRTPYELAQDLAALTSGVSRSDLESIAAAGNVDPSILGGPGYETPWPQDRYGLDTYAVMAARG